MCKNCWGGKVIIIAYSVCVCVCVFVALVIQHAWSCAILSSEICLTLQYFPTFLINGTIFEKKKKKWLEIQCVLNFSTNYVSAFFVLRRTERDTIKKCTLVFIWSTRYFCQILIKLELFPTDFRKIFKYQISRKSVWWEPSCSMLTGGWTDWRTDEQIWRG
jgi:hypothetical protein